MSTSDTGQGTEADQFAARAFRQGDLEADPDDPSVGGIGLDQQRWSAMVHRVRKQTTMMNAMIRIFAWLNGSVILFISVAWGLGLLSHRQPVIAEHVVVALISSTLIQAGLAFITITKFLFPPDPGASAGKRGHRKVGRDVNIGSGKRNRPNAAV